MFLTTVTAEDLEYLYFNIKNTFTEFYFEEKIYLTVLKKVEVKNFFFASALQSLQTETSHTELKFTCQEKTS